jgi:hypothetical protein
LDTRKIKKERSPRGIIKNSEKETRTRFVGIDTRERIPKEVILNGKVAADAATVVFTLDENLSFNVLRLIG